MLLILIFISLKANAFEFFTYHDWCELKLNSDMSWDATNRHISKNKYNNYLKKIIECRSVPYLSSHYNHSDFEFVFMYELALTRMWKPLGFITELKKIDSNPSYLKEYTEKFRFYRIFEDKAELSPVERFQNNVLRSACAGIKRFVIGTEDCNYFDYLNFLGEKSYNYFEDISNKSYEIYLKDIATLNSDLERKSCLVFLNTIFVEKIRDDNGYDYKKYLNKANICTVITGEILHEKPGAVIVQLDKLIYDSAPEKPQLDKVLNDIKNDNSNPFLGESGNYDSALYRAGDFWRTYYGDLRDNEQDFSAEFEQLAEIKDKSFFESFKPDRED